MSAQDKGETPVQCSLTFKLCNHDYRLCLYRLRSLANESAIYATVTVHLYNCDIDSIEIFQFLAPMPLPHVSQDFLDSMHYDHLAHEK